MNVKGESMEERLRSLRLEYDQGRRQLELINARRQEMIETMLRISGAIQVLEELLATEAPAPTPELAQAAA